MITVTARRHRDHLHIACPFCRQLHRHTASAVPGKADGERRAHCHHGTYLIREATP